MEKAFDYLFQAALALGGLLLGWLHVQRNNEVTEMKAAIRKAQEAASDAADAADQAKQSAVLIAFEAGKALSEHKLYAAETFAKKEDVERAIDKAEKRLGEKIVEQGEAQLARLEEIRDRLPRRN